MHHFIPASPDPQQLTAELAQRSKGGYSHTHHPSQPLGGALHQVEGVRGEADSYTGVHRGIIHPEWDRWGSMAGETNGRGELGI